MTRILVTNDDGIRAPGILALANALQDLGEVWVVAPNGEQSAIGHAITLWEPVRIHELGERRFAVTGTPTDCVYIAVARLVEGPIDLCVSGINQGANLGDDVIYSGTVAGAAEAALSDIPSLAVSLASFRSREFDVAATVARRVAESILERGLPRGAMLNLNVPREATEETEIEVTKLGRRTYGKIVTEKQDPRQRSYYWIGGSELGFDDIPGTDCNAIAQGKISLSPVTMDMTHYRCLSMIRSWDEL